MRRKINYLFLKNSPHKNKKNPILNELKQKNPKCGLIYSGLLYTFNKKFFSMINLNNKFKKDCIIPMGYKER